MTKESLNRITELARQIIDNAESMGEASTREDEERIGTTDTAPSANAFSSSSANPSKISSLLPCPFCGGSPEWAEYENCGIVKCSTPSCGAEINIEGWNRRTPKPVSMKDAMSAYYDVDLEKYDTPEEYDAACVKAVLDAAGVKYHE